MSHEFYAHSVEGKPVDDWPLVMVVGLAERDAVGDGGVPPPPLPQPPHKILISQLR